jgi:hypothetical protein
MKRTSLLLAVSFIVALATTSCVENYSNGERIGFVTKFSKRGVCWDSWEGELNLTQTGMNTSSLFDFSIDNDVNDEQVISDIDSAAVCGWKVKLTYHEVWGIGKNFWNNRGETNYFVTKVTVLDKNPIGSVGNNMFQRKDSAVSSKTIHDTIYLVIYKELGKK